MEEIYFPREDSLLIEKHVRKLSKGRVLDMGTGTGILAEAASEKAKSVVGADIDAIAINYCRKHVKSEKISFLQSDLFSNIKGKFDTVVFNPPYLPDDEVRDIALDGGKKGWELIERFLLQAKKHLEKDGIMLLLFSSHTNREKINEILKKNNYSYKLLDSMKLDFEKLYVYLIRNEN